MGFGVKGSEVAIPSRGGPAQTAQTVPPLVCVPLV